MDTMQAFVMGDAHRGEIPKIFDWGKAAKMIKEHKPQIAEAGLIEDWEWTGGTIYADGKPIMDAYCYLLSTWATPTLILDGVEYECYKMGTNDNDGEDDSKANLIWQPEFLEILNNKD